MPGTASARGVGATWLVVMAAARLALALTVFVLGAGGEIVVFPTEGPGLIQDEFEDRPSAFGDSLPLEGLRGLLVVGVPKDGCRPLAPPPGDDNFTGKWIVLLARYNCSFEEKMRNAQASGYAAAIVHNNETTLETMSAKNAVGIRIPSVFVNNDTGADLEINYTYKNDYYIVMNREVPFDINTHLLLPFAVVVGLCLVTIIIFMIVKCIKDRRRAQRHRLPNNSLKKIPTCRYSKGDPYDTCAICLDDYLEGDKLRVLPCAHAYHCKCIDPWLTKNRRVCPVCKRRVFAAGERRRTRSRPRSDSDTDSDDSTTPLVANVIPTQGGTFANQRENPFMAAQRFMVRLRQARSNRGRPSDDTPAATQEEAEVSTPEEVTEYYANGAEGDHVVAGPATAAAAAPFLSGVLNLRNNHFGRGESEETDALLATQSSLPTQTFLEHERSATASQNRRTRSGHRHRSSSETTSRQPGSNRPQPGSNRQQPGSNRQQPGSTRQQPGSNEPQPSTVSPRHSINREAGNERGEIGVAALPNTNLAPDHYVI